MNTTAVVPNEAIGLTPARDLSVASVASALLQQFKEEAGPEPLPKEQDFALRQKYGLVAPQFTLSEQNLTRMGDRHARR